LWFEPERVVEGTQLATDHPNWLFKPTEGRTNKYTGKKDFILNLGIKEARMWLTDYMSDFIRKEGIDYYRQDFNIDPMPYWQAEDPSDRIGISEIRHIEGLYAFWDSLLLRFPYLIIDNCASGGRRIDLETMSRSLPLWRSDCDLGDPESVQNHTYGLNYYIPVHGTGNVSYSPYDFRSDMSSSMILFWDVNSPDDSTPLMKKTICDFKKLRSFHYGDYYPLTCAEKLLQDDVWLAYQLNRPESNDGVILAFRRKNCHDDSLIVKLKGIDKKAFYELTDEDSQIKITQQGENLMKGFPLTLNSKPGSLLIRYKQIR